MCLRPPAVHPHPGGAADLLPQGPGLRGLPADRGAARQAGVLHGHPEDPAQRPGGAIRGQEPQTHAAQVCVVCVGGWVGGWVLWPFQMHPNRW